MKNKKILIISIIVAVTFLACIIGVFLYYQNNIKNQKEYNEVVKRYERIKKIATEINDVIDKKVISIQKFIDTNPDVRR